MFELVWEIFEDEDGRRTACYSVINEALGIRVQALCTDRPTAERLTDLLNSGQVARCHVRDVIEDFIQKLYMI